MREIFQILAVISFIALLCAAVIFGIIVFAYYGTEKPACEQYGRLSGNEISTQFFGNWCLVKYEGRWVDSWVARANKAELKVTQ